jgi:hypothetical protein
MVYYSEGIIIAMLQTIYIHYYISIISILLFRSCYAHKYVKCYNESTVIILIICTVKNCYFPEIWGFMKIIRIVLCISKLTLVVPPYVGARGSLVPNYFKIMIN